jgi:very-short-patch-repair endonuclease
MVAAPSDRRPMALTRDQYVQRYNVATSRAKDQLWLFHSLQLRDISNADDMRFQLLDYCYGVSQRRQNPDADVMITAVSEDERCEPFDSLFEQRVFNRVVDRGYSVIPQFSTDSYRIDMVIVGAQARLAVECDGDRWHGPAQYADDLARQRNLERAGWHFFRIRESAFYLDRAGTMRQLWQMLDSLHIYPSSRQSTLTTSAENVQIAAVSDRVAEISKPAEITVDQT